MRKRLFLLSAVIWLFASCEGPAGRDGLDGFDGVETYWFVREYPVRSTDWELVHDVEPFGSYWRYTINIPELDQDIFKKGHVFCYMYQGSAKQTLLPYTIHLVENGDFWTETYSYEFESRKITLYVNYNDFFMDVRPEATTFRVVLNY